MFHMFKCCESQIFSVASDFWTIICTVFSKIFQKVLFFKSSETWCDLYSKATYIMQLAASIQNMHKSTHIYSRFALKPKFVCPHK